MRVKKARQVAKDVIAWRTLAGEPWLEACRRLPYRLVKSANWREIHLISPKVRMEKRRILEEEEGVFTIAQVLALQKGERGGTTP
jgi:hypothetical protein